jgi:hypothetical protein
MSYLVFVFRHLCESGFIFSKSSRYSCATTEMWGLFTAMENQWTAPR